MTMPKAPHSPHAAGPASQAGVSHTRHVVAGLGLAAVLLVVGVVWWTWPRTPSMPDTMEQARTLVMSSQFQGMSAQEQRPYLDRIREQFGSLDREERRRMMEEDAELQNAMMNVFWRQMESRARDWALATPEEREAMRGQGGGPRGGGEGERPQRPEGERPQRPEGQPGEGGGRPGGGPDPSMIVGHMGDRMANGNPQANTYIGEMFRSHHDRRRERREGK